ncbi:MAG: cob(I)yrinic acid a,c-diamide adenosyltransferase [Candidatus Poseidoniaceae archaeon]|jgi:cob(I)alamin adenosyltransferase|nr:cob(I)yrinic acid a,c-diamide adenosyltransferase [Candidatus Poseidoniaceae archaeon]
MVRITKVHTGGGDGGETSLVDGTRISKSELRMEVVGTCDEVNALLGLALMEIKRIDDSHSDGGLRQNVHKLQEVCFSALSRVQSELFDLGAELACPLESIPEYMVLIDQKDSDTLCEEMDAWNKELPPLESFILPTGSGPIATLHLARTVIRRLERNMFSMSEKIRPLSLQYVNRLSDWVFVLTRWISHRIGEDESLWVPKGKRQLSTVSSTKRQQENNTEIDDL